MWDVRAPASDPGQSKSSLGSATPSSALGATEWQVDLVLARGMVVSRARCSSPRHWSLSCGGAGSDRPQSPGRHLVDGDSDHPRSSSTQARPRTTKAQGDPRPGSEPVNDDRRGPTPGRAGARWVRGTSRPPRTISSVAGSKDQPPSATCGMPSASTVAIRARAWGGSASHRRSSAESSDRATSALRRAAARRTTRNQTTPAMTCMAANATRGGSSADTVKGAG